MKRTFSLAGAAGMALTVALAMPVGAAQAEPFVPGPVAPGQPEGAVTHSAKNLGNCKAEFSIVNKTNVTTYTIDWRIDDEAGRPMAGVPVEVWRTGGMHSKAELPSWPDGGAGTNTAESRTMVSNRAPVTATYVQDLKKPTGTWTPPLPNPGASTHEVSYRIVLGPPGNNGQTPSGSPEWLGDRGWRHITVTGCNGPSGSSGSLDWGSLDFGLFGRP
ncbi:hypothetical protein GCM10023217_27200 [Gordonia alkaliphila]|uniref:Uncharacterized protein n=2 Tax=Gordonia alkaliphila TaxID=1053547 RepID=A0ABP8ZDY0_9ACTN